MMIMSVLRRAAVGAVLVGALSLSACGVNRVNLEIRTGQQFATLSDVRVERDGETLSLEDTDLSGRGLTNLHLRVGAYNGDPADLAAVLNACESANTNCELTVLSKRERELMTWRMSRTAVSDETRNAILRTMARSSAGVSDGQGQSLSLVFDVVMLAPVEE